jgi:hypothetical protein
MIQQYGRGVGQGLYGATAPAIAANPTPTVGVANSGISSGALDVSGAAKGSQLGYGNRVAQKKKLRGETEQPEQEASAPLTGLGTGAASGGTPQAALSKTPLLQNSLAGSPVMQQARGEIQSRSQAQSVQAPQQQQQQQASPAVQLPQRQYLDVNKFNPDANPDLPYDQGHSGGTRGYLEGVGQTIAPGRSTTPLLAQQQILQAINMGVDPGYIQDFLNRNPGDTNRIIEGYASERRNTRGGSWQDYALPSAEEAKNYFGE